MLVERNIPLARFLARTVWQRNREEMDLEEVTSLAYQGLVTAALKFDPRAHGMSEETIENGKAFSAFARRKILGTILDWQRSLDHVGRALRFDYRLILRSGFVSFSEGPSLVVVAEEAGLTVERVREVLLAVSLEPVSRESLAPTDDGDGGPHSDSNVESTAVESTVKRAAYAALRDLDPTAQVIVALRYYDGLELQAIAQMLELALPFVREVHTDAILTLHEAMRSHVEDAGQPPVHRRTDT